VVSEPFPRLWRDGQAYVVMPLSLGDDWYHLPIAVRGIGLEMFRLHARRCPTEVYLHGETLLLAAGVGALFGELERPAVAEAFASMGRAGILQSRGPQAWAIRYSPEWRWQPRQAPTRAELFERDGWGCWYCGRRICLESGHADHCFPSSRGGWDDAANLVASCRRCNCSKGARTHEEWAAAQSAAAGDPP
jgi:hypothetical protein